MQHAAMKRLSSISKSANHSYSYFGAHPRTPINTASASAAASTKSSSSATPGTENPAGTPPKSEAETPYSQKPFKESMAAFSEAEVKKIKKGIEEQGRKAYNYGYVLIGGGMVVLLGFAAYKQYK
ncbi:hypothetical protein BC830DRAFT_1225201 [Chytriomyces sp. MP71]|nr:hypothetical protein BC830DRAFT_1225201 [Chytriomyces sp. MP71]